VSCDRKGKKEGKQETKAVKESDVEKVKASAALWELRLRATEQALAEYREDCRTLARANEQLTSRLYCAEKDWLDITGFLKRQDAAKEEKVNARACVDGHQGCQVCVTKPAQWPIKTSTISELKICPCQTIYTAFKVQQHCYHRQMYCNIYKVTPNVNMPALKAVFPQLFHLGPKMALSN